MLQSNYSRLITVGNNTGGLSSLSNKFFLKESEWVGIVRVGQLAGYPQGYGVKSFVLPLTSGAVSLFDSISVETEANMANGSTDIDIQAFADIIAVAQMSASDDIDLSTSAVIIGALVLDANDSISVITSGELSSVLEAFVTDNVSISSSAEIVGILPLSANDSIALQTDAALIGAFNGASSSTISLSTFCNALFGEGTASAQLTTLLFSGTGTLTAIGSMGGTTEADAGTLTPAQIWAYDNRTLTSIEIDNITVNVDYDKIAEAVWSKTI